MTHRPTSNATRGACARPLAQRAVSIVDTRTRSDPFASRSAVTITLGNCRSRDDETTPGQALSIAVEQDELVACPRPGSGRACLTVRDRTRLAMCHTRYRQAGEDANARACAERIEAGDVPRVLDREYVRGP
jgi:hypothetical protein